MPEMAVAETEKTHVEVTVSVIPFWKRLLRDAMFFFQNSTKKLISNNPYKDIQMNQREFHNALIFVRLITF